VYKPGLQAGREKPACQAIRKEKMKMDINRMIEAAKRTAEAVKEKAKPVAERYRQYVRDNPGMAEGATVGYAVGALTEKIPGVRLLFGPLPRLAGLIAGAQLGATYVKKSRELQKAPVREKQ
jgi:ElaB/YqjD/DUF883 family membrane-anchored ribosome-binding protein